MNPKTRQTLYQLSIMWAFLGIPVGVLMVIDGSYALAAGAFLSTVVLLALVAVVREIENKMVATEHLRSD